MKLLATFLIVFAPVAYAAEDQRAADGDEVVLNRLYPKSRTIEFAASGGLLLNPTYVDTTLLQIGARYHWNETWGVSLTVGAAQTSDRKERLCVESFYNDPLHKASASCAAQDGGEGIDEGQGDVNFGPAYPRIRELRGIVGLDADYTLAYGKQILLHGVVGHFDLRLRFGAAAITSQVYDQRTTVRGDDSRPARGDPKGEGGAAKAGVGIDERDAAGLLYGTDGRPNPQDETSPAVHVALAQEMHFARRFFVLGELGAYVLPSDARGIESFFVVTLGTGMRL